MCDAAGISAYTPYITGIGGVIAGEISLLSGRSQIGSKKMVLTPSILFNGRSLTELRVFSVLKFSTNWGGFTPIPPTWLEGISYP